LVLRGPVGRAPVEDVVVAQSAEAGALCEIGSHAPTFVFAVNKGVVMTLNSRRKERKGDKPWKGGLAAVLALEDLVFWIDQEVLGVAKAATALRHQLTSLEFNGLPCVESVIWREYFKSRTEESGNKLSCKLTRTASCLS